MLHSNAFAVITTVTTAYFSVKYARRGISNLFWLMITMVGYLILIVVDSLNAKYFAVFLVVHGIPLCPCVGTCIDFLSRNASRQTKRIISLALMISIGNCVGIISEQMYRSEYASRFIMRHAINLASCKLAFICTTILIIILHLENRRRDRIYGSITNIIKAQTKSMEDIFGLGTAEDRQ